MWWGFQRDGIALPLRAQTYEKESMESMESQNHAASDSGVENQQ